MVLWWKHLTLRSVVSLAMFIPITAIIETLILRVVSIIIVTAVPKLSAKSKLRVVPERAWRVIFALAGRPISPEWLILDCVSCATIFHPSRIVQGLGSFSIPLLFLTRQWQQQPLFAPPPDWNATLPMTRMSSGGGEGKHRLEKENVMIVDRQADSVKIGFKIFDSKFAKRQEQKTKK